MSRENPYSAPSAEIVPDARDDIKRATRARRFCGFVIDFIAIRVLIVGYFAFDAYCRVRYFGESAASVRADLEKLDASLLQYVYGYVFFFLYYFVSEGLFYRTLGKLVLGMRVMTTRGDKPGFKAMLIRTAVRLVPFEPFSNLTAGAGWHDTNSSTTVVRVVRGRRSQVRDMEPSTGQDAFVLVRQLKQLLRDRGATDLARELDLAIIANFTVDERLVDLAAALQHVRASPLYAQASVRDGVDVASAAVARALQN